MTHYGIGIAGATVGFLMVFYLLLMAAQAKHPMTWWRLGYHFGLYVLDIVLVLTGFILGFGLEVVSWFWVLAPALVGRFVIHMFNTIMIHQGEKERKDPVDHAQTISTPIQGSVRVESLFGANEDIRDEGGAILWSEPYSFSRVRVPGDQFHFLDRDGIFEVISCEKQPSGTVATVVRRVS